MNPVCGSHSDLQYSEEVVRAVAAHDGVDETELPPLYDALDPDALDTVLASARDNGRGRASAAFEYAGHRIVVTDDRTVTIE
jgi:hypothetical protein